MFRPSPDEKHLMVSRLHRPYSYQLPANAFPAEVEIWDHAAKVDGFFALYPREASELNVYLYTLTNGLAPICLNLADSGLEPKWKAPR